MCYWLSVYVHCRHWLCSGQLLLRPPHGRKCDSYLRCSKADGWVKEIFLRGRQPYEYAWILRSCVALCDLPSLHHNGQYDPNWLSCSATTIIGSDRCATVFLQTCLRLLSLLWSVLLALLYMRLDHSTVAAKHTMNEGNGIVANPDVLTVEPGGRANEYTGVYSGDLHLQVQRILYRRPYL
jgi:hypothetical protein